MKKIKKAAVIAVTGIALLTALEQYLMRQEGRAWKVMWNASPSEFRVSGKKTSKSKKSRR